MTVEVGGEWEWVEDGLVMYVMELHVLGNVRSQIWWGVSNSREEGFGHHLSFLQHEREHVQSITLLLRKRQ